MINQSSLPVHIIYYVYIAIEQKNIDCSMFFFIDEWRPLVKFGGDTRPIHMGGGRKDRLGGRHKRCYHLQI